MKILFYGKLADTLGRDMELAVDRCSVGELRTMIAQASPAAAHAMEAGRVRACVADSIVADDHLLAPSDEVEFFPPVSGG